MNILKVRTETLAVTRQLVNEDFSRHDSAEWHEDLKNVVITELLRDIIDEQVGTFWTYMQTNTLHCNNWHKDITY